MERSQPEAEHQADQMIQVPANLNAKGVLLKAVIYNGGACAIYEYNPNGERREHKLQVPRRKAESSRE
jgi:hypothetical protein